MSNRPSPFLTIAKKRLREVVRENRSLLTPGERAEMTAQLTEQLVSLTRANRCARIACYFPINNEPDTREFMRWCFTAGVQVLTPVSRPDMLLDWTVYTPLSTLESGRYGITEVRGERLPPAALADVDIAFIPACAADRTGTRLGWGAGYYDRTLAAAADAVAENTATAASLTEPLPNRPMPKVYAVLYDPEIADRLPQEEHDYLLDGIVTPRAVITIPQRRRR